MFICLFFKHIFQTYILLFIFFSLFVIFIYFYLYIFFVYIDFLISINYHLLFSNIYI